MLDTYRDSKSRIQDPHLLVNKSKAELIKLCYSLRKHYSEEIEELKTALSTYKQTLIQLKAHIESESMEKQTLKDNLSKALQFIKGCQASFVTTAKKENVQIIDRFDDTDATTSPNYSPQQIKKKNRAMSVRPLNLSKLHQRVSEAQTEYFPEVKESSVQMNKHSSDCTIPNIIKESLRITKGVPEMPKPTHAQKHTKYTPRRYQNVNNHLNEFTRKPSKKRKETTADESFENIEETDEKQDFNRPMSSRHFYNEFYSVKCGEVIKEKMNMLIESKRAKSGQHQVRFSVLFR